MGGKLSRGIRVRGNRLWIEFSFKRVRCRESLGIRPTIQNVRYAENLKQQIDLEIKTGTFDYKRHFPESPNLAKFGLDIRVEGGQTVEDRLIDFMERHEKGRISHTTYVSDMRIVENQLIPAFGDYLIKELLPSHIGAWVKEQAKTKKRKTVANQLLPLRNMYSEIEINEDHPNPVKKVNLNLYYTKKQFAAVEPDRYVDPFDIDEIYRIIRANQDQKRHMLQFWFFTGLRPGELFALRWSRVNFTKKTVLIDRSISDDVESPTKTGETRTVILLPQAVDALRNQQQLTGDNEFVFLWRGEHFKFDRQLRRRIWRPALKAANVRYRKPYQARHSYATMLLMNGEDERFVARQLGHADLEMIHKRYGKYLPNREKHSDYALKADWANIEKTTQKRHSLKVVK